MPINYSITHAIALNMIWEKQFYVTANREWKVKVRRTGNRGRYLKISSYPDYKQSLRASADKYKSYLQITSDEWEVFYRTAKGLKDSRARAILDKLVGI
ncbi:hypothetical protein [Nostoc sp.]|uniref:hypothetical protein n=1 Tax=Nostoc sp. TaxID=1180 RepID=UPI002FFC429A